MWTHVSPSRNFVNLGTLYSHAQWMGLVHSSRNFVNLGTLYSLPPWAVPVHSSENDVNVCIFNKYYESKKAPLGYGYFDDGSMYIASCAYLEHDVFEARMKIVTQLFSTSVHNIWAIEAKRSHGKRVIVIDNGLSALNQRLHLAVRSADDKERISMYDNAYSRITVGFDKTGTQPVSTRVRKQYTLGTEHKSNAEQALQTFRGTLIDGTLQPNVRLGNGLQVLSLPRHAIPRGPNRREKREKVALEHEAGSRTSLQLPPKSEREARATVPIPKKPITKKAYQKADSELEAEMPDNETSPDEERAIFQTVSSQPNQKARRKEIALERKAAELRAKEKELEHKNEILRLKYRAWRLEQKLAERDSAVSTRRPENARRRPGVRRGYDVDKPGEPPKARQRPSTMEESSPGPQVESTGDHFAVDEFTLDEPTPPSALANLRSRIAIPGRRTYGDRRRT